jgi:hypothetical protein
MIRRCRRRRTRELHEGGCSNLRSVMLQKRSVVVVGAADGGREFAEHSVFQQVCPD